MFIRDPNYYHHLAPTLLSYIKPWVAQMARAPRGKKALIVALLGFLYRYLNHSVDIWIASHRRSFGCLVMAVWLIGGFT